MSRTKKEKREIVAGNGLHSVPERTLEEEAIRNISPIEAAREMTPEQIARAIQLLKYLDDGCSFGMSRSWRPGLSCGQDNGRGFDCSHCAARQLLKELI